MRLNRRAYPVSWISLCGLLVTRVSNYTPTRTALRMKNPKYFVNMIVPLSGGEQAAKHPRGTIFLDYTPAKELTPKAMQAAIPAMACSCLDKSNPACECDPWPSVRRVQHVIPLNGGVKFLGNHWHAGPPLKNNADSYGLFAGWPATAESIDSFTDDEVLFVPNLRELIANNYISQSTSGTSGGFLSICGDHLQ